MISPQSPSPSPTINCTSVSIGGGGGGGTAPTVKVPLSTVKSSGIAGPPPGGCCETDISGNESSILSKDMSPVAPITSKHTSSILSPSANVSGLAPALGSSQINPSNP